jgi:hypothetical protein
METRLVRILWLWLALAFGLDPALAEENGIVGTWTVVIPSAFPGYVYTWRVAASGTYLEDGRDGTTGQRIQPTLRGKWMATGERLILRQTGISYVFDGALSGGNYAGTLFLDGRPVSRFCAAKGRRAPPSCSAADTPVSALAGSTQLAHLHCLMATKRARPAKIRAAANRGPRACFVRHPRESEGPCSAAGFPLTRE